MLSTSLCVDAGAVVWACAWVCLHGLCALMLELLVRRVSVPTWCDLILELLFGYVVACIGC